MGAKDRGGFPDDGESPVGPVTVSPFRIAAEALSNEEIRGVVLATGYVTDTEHW